MVSEVKERFSKCFPRLKIEFYSKPHHFGEQSPEKYLIDTSKKIGEIRHSYQEGCLEIKSWDTVATIEKDFRKQLGLNIQIFRKENEGWFQTSNTDKYNLLQQSEMSF